MTQFQSEVLRGCEALTNLGLALEWSGFQETATRGRTCYTARIRGPRHRMKVSVYEREVDLSLDGKRMIFDESEYQSLDELKRAFLSTLTETVHQISARAIR
jgi:hypothetical protein